MGECAKALVAAAFAVLVAMFAVPAAALADAPPAAPLAAYAYNSQQHAATTADTTSERGPPASYDHAITSYTPEGLWPLGPSARLKGPQRPTTNNYDHLVPLVQTARGSHKAREPVGRAWSGSATIQRSDVAANTGRTAARTCLKSFAGATLVLMADGSKKPIEDINVGDRVIATDPETGERVARKVTKVWVHDDQVLDLVVAGEVTTTTEDHLFWSVTDQRFERADQLGRDEVVLGDGDLQVTVAGFRIGSERTGLAYNLSIAGVHTYHVGDGAVLVHNDCDPFDAARALRGADPEDVLDAIPDNWMVSSAPKATGGGMKFSNPANRSQIMIYESRWVSFRLISQDGNDGQVYERDA